MYYRARTSTQHKLSRIESLQTCIYEVFNVFPTLHRTNISNPCPMTMAPWSLCCSYGLLLQPFNLSIQKISLFGNPSLYDPAIFVTLESFNRSCFTSITSFLVTEAKGIGSLFILDRELSDKRSRRLQQKQSNELAMDGTTAPLEWQNHLQVDGWISFWTGEVVGGWSRG